MAYETRTLLIGDPGAPLPAYTGTIYLMYDGLVVAPPYFCGIEVARRKLGDDDLKMLYNMLLVGGEMRVSAEYVPFFARADGAAARGAEMADLRGGCAVIVKRTNAQYEIAYTRIVDFIVAGSQKGGTTALALNIQKHPDIYMDPAKDPRKSEPHFYDIKWKNGLAFYKKGFNYKFARVGEKTPDLMYLPHTFPMIHSINPHVKLIVVLREPVSRAFSAWKMENSRGGDSRTFREAVEDELANKIGEIRTFYTAATHYLQRGLYASQLTELLQWVPLQNLLVLFSEKVKADMIRQYARVYKFLDLPPLASDIENNYSLEFEGTSASEPIDSALQKKLHKFFINDIKDLEEMLKEKSGWL